MPWNRLRSGKNSQTDLRRHSTFDPALFEAPRDQDGPQHGHLSTPGVPSPMRFSVSQDDIDPSPTFERPTSPPVQQRTPRHQRFSMLRFRHASDPQLSKTLRDHDAAVVPPIPQAPAILATAPTFDRPEPSSQRKSALTLPRRFKLLDGSGSRSSKPPSKPPRTTSDWTRPRDDSVVGSESVRASRIMFDEPDNVLNSHPPPPPYADESNAASESSRSDRSSGDHRIYATTTTTHTVSTTTTFFRIPRRNKNKTPLFPLPVRIPPPSTQLSSTDTPRASGSSQPPGSPGRESPTRTPPATALHRPFLFTQETNGLSPPAPSPLRSPSPSQTQFASPAVGFLRKASTSSHDSSNVLGPPMQSDARERSMTLGLPDRKAEDEPLPTPPITQSGRTSTSTTARSSLGGLFNLARLRNNSEPPFLRNGSPQLGTPGTPGSPGSKQNSFNLPREPHIVVPERQEGDTPAKYLVRLEEAVRRGAIAITLSKSDDEFTKNVLRSYTRRFKFFGDPIDMAVRKLLMEVELPKETQQIDRVLQSFADRYHECNPGIYISPDEAYFIAFSVLILHTDVFNKNNKHKMQKQDYTKNASGQGVAEEILECFYDNTSYTPFIHVEDDVDINSERPTVPSLRKTIFRGSTTDKAKKNSNEPIDPYTLILDNKLSKLRPTLKEVMDLDDPYSYLGTAASLNIADLHKTFFRSGILQIVSSRSRPEAFTSPTTITNPADAHPGVVDIKITKVGILWRKDPKKKKARSPWQEWGALLTGSQLYFFRNNGWVKSLMHQYESHHRHGHAGTAVTFKPPLDQFTSDALISTENAVALLDSTYKKHKHAFIFVRHGGFEETFLADDENDMNDWLAKLNYAAAFKTAGVRMRDINIRKYEKPTTRAIRRLSSSYSSESRQNLMGDASIQAKKVNAEEESQIQAARMQTANRKIEELEEKLTKSNRQLEDLLRNGRHLQILAPIQNKTREQVVLAAGRMSAKIKWARMEIWRLRCHKDILSLDLEEELKGGIERPIRNEQVADPSPTRAGLARLGSKASAITTPQKSALPANLSRPVTQTSVQKAADADECLKTPSRNSPLANAQKPQGSWDLPPLSSKGSPPSTGPKSITDARGADTINVMPESSPTNVRATAPSPRLDTPEVGLTSPGPELDENENEMLKEAGLVTAERISEDSRRPTTASDIDPEKDPARSTQDLGDGRTKVRRSLHKTLREAHVPNHNRSRKGKDSASSAPLSEDSSSLAESDGLARGAGSFTVHGKKASVITFGSEWQSMSPEERLKLRKQAQHDDSKLTESSAIEDGGESMLSATSPDDDMPAETLLSHRVNALPTVQHNLAIEPRPTISSQNTDEGSISLNEH